MNIKQYIVDKGDGSFSMVAGDIEDPGFASSLKNKDCWEHPEGELLCEDDPSNNFVFAYKLENRKVVIDIERAKEGYLAWLKELREIKLKQLDIEQMKAMGEMNFDKMKEIEDVKKNLRDMPKLIDWDSITSIYDLTHVFPPILL